MEISLTIPASGMIFRMLQSPHLLAPDQPYKAPDSPAAQEIVALTKWVVSGKIAELGDEGGQKVWKFKEYSGKLKECYIKRLKEVCEHYKNSGRLVQNCEGYEDLLAALKGEKVKLDPVEESD